jgi:hypothetical protein
LPPRAGLISIHARAGGDRDVVRALEQVTPSKQRRILGMSTLAFTVCFAVWTIFSIIGV